MRKLWSAASGPSMPDAAYAAQSAELSTEVTDVLTWFDLRAAPGPWGPRLRPTGLTASLRPTLVAVLHAAPHAYGWCRTRWSCATLALTLHAQYGVTGSAETVRRWLHAIGWVWKRAKPVDAKNDMNNINYT
jgi:hypothetical protein